MSAATKKVTAIFQPMKKKIEIFSMAMGMKQNTNYSLYDFIQVPSGKKDNTTGKVPISFNFKQLALKDNTWVQMVSRGGTQK